MKEFGGIGRGYWLTFLVIIISGMLTAIVLFNNPLKYQWALEYWQSLLVFLMPTVLGAKAIEKVGTSWADRQKSGGKK